MVKNSPPPMPMLCALNSPTHNRAAMEASTAEPLRFKMSLQTWRMLGLWIDVHDVQWQAWKLLALDIWTITFQPQSTSRHLQPQLLSSRSGPRVQRVSYFRFPCTHPGKTPLQPQSRPPDQQQETSWPFSWMDTECAEYRMVKIKTCEGIVWYMIRDIYAI